MKLINLTPHPITIISGEEQVTINPSGVVARLREDVKEIGTLEVEGHQVPIVRKILGAVEGLPPVEKIEEDTRFLVSSIVLSALRGTEYERCCLAPDTGPSSAVRDSQGRIVGVRRLIAP